MAATTYSAMLNKIRELSFDRFVTPTFFILQRQKLITWKFQITSTAFIITDATPTAHTFLFNDYPTLDELLKKIIEICGGGVEILYSGSFIPTEPSDSLSLQAETTFEKYIPIFRQYYFSNAFIEKFFREYSFMVLQLTQSKVDAIDWTVELAASDFDEGEQDHFALWIAVQLVNKRRLYELANLQLQQSTIGGVPGGTAGGSNFNSFSLTGPGQTLQVQIGDVFTLTDDTGSSSGVSNGGSIPQGIQPPWNIGSDNVLMDYYSFWYRLQMWLRERLEFLFGDTSLRVQTGIEGNFKLDKYSSRSFQSWFESYPWAWNNGLIGSGRARL